MKNKNSNIKVNPLSKEEICELFHGESTDKLIERGGETARLVHGEDILLRGLIEYSNVCISNCLYCGIRLDNRGVNRYRIEEQDILDSVKAGYDRGLRTFVLQGGEDPLYTVDRIALLTESIKNLTNGEAAVTLSCGMLSLGEYRTLRAAGADRYLLRFETSDSALHAYLRDGKTLKDRLNALDHIGRAGFQRGSGFMTGLPGETEDTRLNNILLCRELDLDMVGIGPFIPHPGTPLGQEEKQDIEQALRGTALLRMALPLAHIPATTAAGTLQSDGRELMIKAGANVLMPNLTGVEFKKDYLLYPGKICLDESGIQCIGCLSMRVKTVDRKISFSRGDSLRLTGSVL